LQICHFEPTPHGREPQRALDNAKYQVTRIHELEFSTRTDVIFVEAGQDAIEDVVEITY
jgi:hypothetical protein